VPGEGKRHVPDERKHSVPDRRLNGVRTDEQLLARVAGGHRDAFAVLYERHAERILRFAMRVVRAPHLAEEVLQETMMVVWNEADRFEGRSKATTWMLGIARNLSHNLLRREARGARQPNLPVVGEDPGPSAERSVRVEAAVGRLSPRLREVLHLVFHEELTLREVAEILGIPEGTVKSRMYHARKALAKELR
jgi:RNA polymerase sigma-70 factor (ECF subfamily)